jgi:hypothetical protein
MIGEAVQRIIGKCVVPGLNGNTVRIPTYNLLEAVGDRLLDLFLLELDETPCRMEAFVPDGLLLARRVTSDLCMISGA